MMFGNLIAAAAILAAADINDSDVLARLGDAELTQADVRAAMVQVPEDLREGVLDDPKRLGEMLTKILIRRALVADAELEPEVLAQAAMTGQKDAAVKLALSLIPRQNIDELAIQREIRRMSSGGADKGGKGRMQESLRSDAREQLIQQARQEIRMLHDEMELAGLAESQGLLRTAIGQAVVRQSVEERLLRAYKERFLKEQVGQDLSSLARERYLTQPSKFHSEERVDFAAIALPDDIGFDETRWISTLEQALASGNGFDGYATALGNLLKGRAKPPLAVQKDYRVRQLPAGLALGHYDDRVYSTQRDGKIVLLAFTNYRPPRQLPFEDVAKTIEDELRLELGGALWDRLVSQYHELPLEANPEQIAALRKLSFN